MSNAILAAQRLLQENPQVRLRATTHPLEALRSLGERAHALLATCSEAEATFLLKHCASLPPPERAPEVVLTMPPRIRHRMTAQVAGGHATTRRRVQDLLREATREVLLLAPYCHPGAIPDLAPGLNAAAAAGARVRIVLRRHADWDNAAFVAALRREPGGAGADVLEVLDEDHLSHAKVVIVDGRSAYVGSGNLTPQGYGTNLEAGAILHGTAAQDLRNAVEWYLSRVRLAEAGRPDAGAGD